MLNLDHYENLCNSNHPAPYFHIVADYLMKKSQFIRAEHVLINGLTYYPNCAVGIKLLAKIKQINFEQNLLHTNNSIIASFSEDMHTIESHGILSSATLSKLYNSQQLPKGE